MSSMEELFLHFCVSSFCVRVWKQCRVSAGLQVEDVTASQLASCGLWPLAARFPPLMCLCGLNPLNTDRQLRLVQYDSSEVCIFGVFLHLIIVHFDFTDKKLSNKRKWLLLVQKGEQYLSISWPILISPHKIQPLFLEHTSKHFLSFKITSL